MATRVKYTRHHAAEAQVLGPVADQAAYRTAQRLRGRVISNIRAKGRIDTGKMIRGVQVRLISKTATAAAYSVYSDAWYTAFQEDGTRAHGPRVASVMVFTPKGSNQVVFAKWVRGVTPGHFFRDAVRDARASDALP